ncbi:MAG: response regulator transcription factor [Firmicutes bacterium]|nr:response regulator transcription factor [Bacillota bacterium]
MKTKILLVEDDQALSMGVSFSLEREGYEITLAKNFSIGKEKFNKDEYDLIILDVTLPDGNGFDLCKYIRNKCDVPIIFLTAKDEEINIVLGLDIGGDDYITKPFRLKEFISRVNAILRRTSKTKKITSRNLKLDLNEMKAYKNNTLIQLTPVEFKVLNLFIKNPKQVLTRNNILEKIFDTDGEFIDNNTLSVYIRRLREKIEDDPSNPDYILTVRGIGYKWNEKSKKI